MSDFLSNLAAKNLNRAPIIQPRLLARFEPAPARRMPTSSPSFDPEALERVESVESEVPRSPIVAQRHTPINSFSPIEPQPRSIESPLRPASSLLRVEPQTIAPRLPEPLRAEPREVVNVTEIRSVIERPVIHASTTERLIIEKEAQAPDRTTPPIGAETTAKSSPPEDHAAIRPRPIVTPVIERIVQERGDRSQPPPIQTELTPRETSTVHKMEQAPPAAEPPTIHVTIGRIEVRATTPAVPAKQAPRSSSALSLDEYLRSREGGKR
jgi:hypothetical protein